VKASGKACRSAPERLAKSQTGVPDSAQMSCSLQELGGTVKQEASPQDLGRGFF
jgi:hypothetical protein